MMINSEPFSLVIESSALILYFLCYVGKWKMDVNPKRLLSLFLYYSYLYCIVGIHSLFNIPNKLIVDYIFMVFEK